MIVFSYRDGGINEGALPFKAGLEQSKYLIDFTDGQGTSTISAITTGAVTSANVDTTATVVSGVTTVGVTVAQVSLLTAGTSGSQTAVNAARFRIRTTATLSDSRVLIYDAFLRIQSPTYGPGSG